MRGETAGDKATRSARAADDLAKAIGAGHFVLYRQAIASLRPGPAPARYHEILIRYEEEERLLLPPGAFFLTLEAEGLMPLLDRWVLTRVLRWHSSPRPRTGLPWRNSVNLAEDTLYDENFASFVLERLREQNGPREILSLEVSEEVALANLGRLYRLMATLRPAGCSFAISSFAARDGLDLLDDLPMRFLKIDGRLIRAIASGSGEAEKLQPILAKCRRLGIETIGEFVEDQPAVDALVRLGFDYAQGFFIARPERLTDRLG